MCFVSLAQPIPICESCVNRKILDLIKSLLSRRESAKSPVQRQTEAVQPMESRPELDYPDLTIRSAREIVHLQYSAASLPAPPSDEWTRFVCISDTHSRNFDVPDGDVLLHSGDLTMTGTLDDFEKTMEWITSLPHKIKMYVFCACFVRVLLIIPQNHCR